MKYRLLTVIISVTALLSMTAKGSAQQLDSATANALGNKLDEYLDILEKEPAEIKCEEADFLISSCADSLIRQYTALHLYSHFIKSKLMGDETPAVHIFDRWFADGTVKMRSELDFMNARIFAEFNRQSLIGMKAPELSLKDISGESVRLFEDGTWAGQPSILFFYDSGCASCKMESIMLRSLLDTGEYQVDLHAIYTQQSQENMGRFIQEYLDISNPAVKTDYLWDPDFTSDFQMKYGILQTPGIFLVSRDGTIIGRKLDAAALGQLLEIYCKPYEYGSKESSAFYDRAFSSYGGNPGCEDVKNFCDAAAKKTLEQKDTAIFKQIAGDLMYWLAASRGEGVKCGLEYLVDKYIAGKPAIWASSEDSLKILSYSDILKDLLSKSTAGKKLPAAEVTGVMKTGGREKQKTVRLDKLRETTVIFHSEGCSFCEAELSAADSLARADRKKKFFLIDIDSILDSDQDAAFRLFDLFDLTMTPYITAVDKKGIVTRKYMSLVHK